MKRCADWVVSHMKIEYIFLIVALIVSLYSAKHIPFPQIPDEQVHLRSIGYAFGAPSYTNEILDDIFTSKWISESMENKPVNFNIYYEKVSHKTKNVCKITDLKPTISAVKYLPQGIGLYIGLMLHLTVYKCFWLSRLFSILFYLLIGFIVLKLVPYRKDLFFFCLIMPMVIQQCSSISYDAVLIPVSFLLTAYILNLSVREKPVGWRSILLILFLTCVIALIKIPYALLAGIILIVPRDKYQLYIGKKGNRQFDVAKWIYKFRILVIVLLIMIMALVMFIFRNHPYIKTFFACFINLRWFSFIVADSFYKLGDFYMRTFVGDIGRLQLSYSYPFIMIFFCVLTYLCIVGEEKDYEKMTALTIKKRLWMVFLVACTVVVIFMSQVTWTFMLNNYSLDESPSKIAYNLLNFTWIDGVQGRYFLPQFPALVIALSGNRYTVSLSKDKKYYIARKVFMILFYSYMLYRFCRLILVRYR